MPGPITPLPLSSPRWATLKAHFDNAAKDGDEVAAVTKLLRRWERSIGTYAEEYEHDPLRESYLHQGTILDVAYAVVPHLVVQLPRLDPDRRAEVLDDLALVDAIRLTPRSKVEKVIKKLASMPDSLRDHFIQTTRDRHPPLADDLAQAYLPAIARAQKLAGKAWNKQRSEPMGPHRWRRHVRFLRECGLSDADIAFGVKVLTQEDGGGALVYQGPDDAKEGLLAAPDAPPGWVKRTGLRTARGRLVLNALNALAWIERHVPVAKMLRRSPGR